MITKLFIDGEEGTTGLGIRERLVDREDLELLSIDTSKRKDKKSRRDLINAADIVILCLPDDAAREAVDMIENKTTRVIDSSTAHRTANGWVYGFPEYSRKQKDAIAGAARVTNPGCYALASIGILRPLIESKILPPDWPISVNAVSGYSGGGKKLISAFEDANGSNNDKNFFYYSLNLQHKHVPEITYWSGLTHEPIFSPSVGSFFQGMIVQVPLSCWALPKISRSLISIHQVFQEFYSGYDFIKVTELSKLKELQHLNPESLNGTNDLHIHVFSNVLTKQVIVSGVLDNLGKGASGQAVQNLNIMIGAPEYLSLN